MSVDFKTMTSGEFISSVAAQLMIASYTVPDYLDNTVIMAVLHKEDGTMHGILTLALSRFEHDEHGTLRDAREAYQCPTDVAVRLVVIADVEHATRGAHAIQALADSIEQNGVQVTSRLITPAIEAGLSWLDLGTKESGKLPDPAMTAPALAALVDGHPPFPKPGEFIELFAPHAEPVDTRTARDQQRDNPAQFGRDTLLEIRAAIMAYARTYDAEYDTDWSVTGVIGADTAADERARILDNTADRLTARAGILAEMSGSGRDAMFGLAVIDTASAARIYVHMAKKLDGPRRAQLLGVAAVLYDVDNHRYHARAACSSSIAATLVGDDDGPGDEIDVPLTTRTLIAADEVDAEVDTARRLLATGYLAARRYGIETPEFDLYPTE